MSVKIEKEQIKDKPELLLWKIAGSLGTESINDISSKFEEIINQNYKFLIAEMSNVNFISSAALGQFMGCRQMLVEKGGDMVFSGVNLDIKTKLSAMGALKIFKFYNELRTAINAYEWEVEKKPEKVYLSFPPELKFVPAVRQMVSRIAKQKGYSQRDAFRIETIVDEICNNAVEHGSVDQKKNIEATVIIGKEKIELEVVNTSDPNKIEHLKEISNSLKTLSPKHDERRGRGLALIKMLSNKLDINFSGDGTSVHVTKLREE